MAKYIIPYRVFMERLVSKIPGSKLDAGEGLIIPHINVAIVVEDWGPLKYDRFSMFHFDEHGLDNQFLSQTFIPADNPYPIDYVAMFCMPILIEKYYGRYIDDVDIPQRCIYYWNKMMADNNAETSFKPRTK